jgi:hypothetical protein
MVPRKDASEGAGRPLSFPPSASYRRGSAELPASGLLLYCCPGNAHANGDGGRDTMRCGV